MVDGTERLKVKALLALEEVARQADHEPLSKTRQLRFLLAFLYSLDGGERWPYDQLWREATAPVPKGTTPAAARIGRSQTVNACLNAIYRGVGVERTSTMIYQDVIPAPTDEGEKDTFSPPPSR
jgi:hypothetical protein